MSDVKEISEKLFYDCRSLKKIVIPSTVEKINKDAFCNCTTLSEINIPKALNQIDSDYFKSCKSLSNITVDTENKRYSYINNALIDNEKEKEVIFVSKTISPLYEIKEGVEKLSNNALFNCAFIETLIIGKDVKRLSTSSLSKLRMLKTINVDKDNNYFSSKDGLLFDKEQKYLLCVPKRCSEEIVLPSSVKVIPKQVRLLHKNIKLFNE